VSFRQGRLVFSAAMAVLGVGLVAASLIWPSPSALRGIAGLLLVLGGAYSAYNTAVTRLSLSAAGIEFRGLTGSTAASWSQVSALRHVATGRAGPYLEVILAGGRGRFQLSDLDFGIEGHDSPVIADLRAFAPQLFTED
jgi:hypothetical protein